MTGQEFDNKLLTQIGEVGSGFADSTRKNNYIQTASYNIWDKKIEEFQSTQKITRETRQLMADTGTIVPTNGTIDLSSGSSEVTDFYSFVKLLVTSTYRDTTLARYAKERPQDQFQSDFTAGTPSNPRYSFSGDVLNVEPADKVVGAILTYFKKPFPIDVTDNTTQIPYNGKLIELLIQETINVISEPNRDQWLNQISIQSETKNP